MTAEPDGIPSRIGEYPVLARLGAGGMGEVFLAEDERLTRKVAIKRLLPASASDTHACRRLLTEARAAARLDHPNICAIYEVGEDAGAPFIVMPVVDGQTLAARLMSGPLPIADAVSIAAQVADALAAAHAQGILHRDIKPPNLMIDTRGQVRVMDFGVARIEETDEDRASTRTVSHLTAPGTTVGTVAYMSPEQARGERVDARSDLFNLGVVLYEMVGGCRPFDRRSMADGLTAVLTEEPSPIARVRPEAPSELQRIISKALRKPRDERYQSAADLHVDLRNLLRSLQSGTLTVPMLTAAPSWWTSGRIAAGGLGLLALAAVVGTGVLMSRFAGRQATSAGGTIEIGSLAVLPLVNNSGNPDKEFVSDGITESLIASLSQLPKLRVVSRNTVFMFKGKTADAQKIAKQLGVAAVMTGTISKADDQLVIDIELSDAKDASVILSRRYLQPSSRAPSIESDIAQDVARNLQTKLTGDVQRQLARLPTANGDAYQLYLKGRFFYNRQTPESLHQAITYYRQAIALDPSYAQAYVGAAESSLDLGNYFEAPKEMMPLAKTYANRGLEADPVSEDARIILGLISLLYDWDWAAAARATTKSGTMIPRAIGMFSCAAHLLESTGHHKEADSELRHALAEDPLSVPMNTEVGCNAYYSRRYDEAVRGYREALSLDAGNVVALWGLGRTLNQQKKYAEATAELAKVDPADASQPLVIAETAYGYAASGRTADAGALLKKLNARSKVAFVDPYLMATVYIGLNEKTRALEFLEKAYEAKSAFMVSLAGEPKWDGIRSGHYFNVLVKLVGF